MQRYNGDPARVAVAYFSAPKNVASIVSNTPWKADTHDGNGKYVSSYVNDVLHRLKQPGIAGGAAPGSWAAAGSDRGFQPLEPLPDSAAALPLTEAPNAQPSAAVSPPPAAPTTPTTQAPPEAPDNLQIKASALAAIEARTDLNDREKQIAATRNSQQIAESQMILGANEQARKDARDKAYDAYLKKIETRQAGPQIVQEIANDPRFNGFPEAREHMFALAERSVGNGAEEASDAYGSGFWPMYRQITTENGAAIDPAEIVRRAGPGGDLTLAGVGKLMAVRGDMAKGVDEQAINRAKVGALQYLRQKLSFDQEMLVPGVPQSMARDPKGEQIFNAQAIPRYESMWDAWRQSNPTKSPWDFLTDRKRLDDLAESLRPKREMQIDRLSAEGVVPEPANMPLPPPPANVRPEVWTPLVSNLPLAPDGRPVSHYAWGQVLSTLAADPSPRNVALLKASKWGQAQGVDYDAIAAALRGGVTAPQAAAPAAPARPNATDAHLSAARKGAGQWWEGVKSDLGKARDKFGKAGETIERAWNPPLPPTDNDPYRKIYR